MRELALYAAALLMTATTSVQAEDTPPGFLGWIDEAPIATGSDDIMDWCLGSAFGVRPKCAYKMIRAGSTIVDDGGHKHHDFIAPEEDVKLRIHNIAYVKPRNGEATSPIDEAYVQNVAMRFADKIDPDTEVHEGLLVQVSQTAVLPAGRVGMFLDPFFGVSHPDCDTGGSECAILSEEVLEMISVVEVISGAPNDDPYTNVARLKNGQLVYRELF